MEEIDLGNLLKMFWRRKYIIVFVTVIGIIAGYVYNAYLTTPKYKATATFLLSNSTNSEMTPTDVTLNSKIINNYTELIKSDTILDEVIRDNKIYSTKSTIKNSISIKVKSNTEYVELSVVLPDKNEATVLANGILEVLSEKVKDMYNMENVRVVDEAKTPTSPCNIKPIRYAAIGGAICFILTCVIILAYNLFDDTIKDENDVDSKVGLQVLATFGKQSNSEKLSWNPKAEYVEGFKALRTNLQFSKSLNEKQVIAVSSIFPGEGKSWITTNLAIAFAKADYHVLVIDADLRKGIQHRKFQVEQKPGLVEIIRHVKNIESIDSLRNSIKETAIDNVDVMPSGGNILDSAEMLLSNKVTKIIEVLKNKYDVIIIDSTPSALVTDAVVLSRLVDTNIIVTEFEKTRIRDLKKMKREIENVGGSISGIVINKVNNSKSRKYYYYYGNEQSLVTTSNKHAKGKRMAS